jgi:predicted small secreted protein
MLRAGMFVALVWRNVVLFNHLKGKTMKRIISVVGILLFTIGLTACNTMSGFGKDVERGGEKVQGAAERAK